MCQLARAEKPRMFDFVVLGSVFWLFGGWTNQRCVWMTFQLRFFWALFCRYRSRFEAGSCPMVVLGWHVRPGGEANSLYTETLMIKHEIQSKSRTVNPLMQWRFRTTSSIHAFLSCLSELVEKNKQKEDFLENPSLGGKALDSVRF